MLQKTKVALELRFGRRRKSAHIAHSCAQLRTGGRPSVRPRESSARRPTHSKAERKRGGESADDELGTSDSESGVEHVSTAMSDEKLKRKRG